MVTIYFSSLEFVLQLIKDVKDSDLKIFNYTKVYSMTAQNDYRTNFITTPGLYGNIEGKKVWMVEEVERPGVMTG